MPSLKNTIPPPIVALFFGALMWLAAKYVPGLAAPGIWPMVTALVIVPIGIFFCLAGAVSFRRAKTTVNPLKPETATSLVTAGIYQYSRNPMYVGFALFLLAWAVYLSSPVALLGVVGFVLYMNHFQIAPEEAALETLFGREFAAYKARVRRWL